MTNRMRRVSSFVKGCVATSILTLSMINGLPSVVLAAPRSGGPNPDTVVAIQFVQGHTKVTYESGVIVIDGSQIDVSTLKPPKDGKTGVESDDYQAFIKNGYRPIEVPAAEMVRSTTGVTPQVTPPINIPNCYSPPASFDISTASDADLAKYGFPPISTSGMSRAQYNEKYSWMKVRVCSIRGSNGRSNGAAFVDSFKHKTSAASAPLSYDATTSASAFMRYTYSAPWYWAGNVADQNQCFSQPYSS